jgi:hypothetical protein
MRRSSVRWWSLATDRRYTNGWKRDGWTAARRGRGERINRVGEVCGVRQTISGVRNLVHKH